MDSELLLTYVKMAQDFMDTRNVLLFLAALYVLQGIGVNISFALRWLWRLFLLSCILFHVYWYYDYIPHSFKSVAANVLRFFKSNEQ